MTQEPLEKLEKTATQRRKYTRSTKPPKNQIVQIRLTDEMREQMELRAAPLGMSLSEYCRMLIANDIRGVNYSSMRGQGTDAVLPERFRQKTKQEVE